MKLLKITLLFGGLLALAMSLSAETALINVNVPFTFVAGGKTLPAGQYTIGEGTGGGFLLIRGSQPNSTALVLAVNSGQSANREAGVKFSRHGSTVVMSTIDIPGGASYSVVSTDQKSAAALSVALPRK
jgi:hypothetical protein